MKSINRFLFAMYLITWPSTHMLLAQSFYTEAGNVVFISRAPLLEFEGKSNHLTGIIDFTTDLLDFYLDLNTLDTGIDLRNRHMRESYLETSKYPFAEFTGTFVPKIDWTINTPQKVEANGKFTIHGVSNNIQIMGSVTTVNNNEVIIEAEWTVLLSDYNIRIPRVVFYELSEVQTVKIIARMIRRD